MKRTARIILISISFFALLFSYSCKNIQNQVGFAQSPIGQFFGATGYVTGALGTTTTTGTTLCSVYAPTGGITNAWCSGGTFSSASSLDGIYRGPDHIAFDGTYIYVAQYPYSRVDRVVAATGAFAGAIGKSTAIGLASSYTVDGVTYTIPACAIGAQTAWCAGGVFQSGSTPAILGDGVFSRPMGIAVATDPSDGISYLYLNSNSSILPVPPNLHGNANSRIQRFVASTGVFAGSIGNTTATTGSASSYTANGVIYTIPACAATGAQTAWCAGGTFADSTVDGGFDYAQGMTVNGSYLYVVDRNNNRVQRFNLSSGVFAGAIGKASSAAGTCVSGAQTTWCYGGTFVDSTTTAIATARDGMFYFTLGSATSPEGIAHDSSYLYVADTGNNRIEKFTLDGAFVGAVGKVSSTAGTCPASGATNSWCTGGGFDTSNVVPQTDGNFNSPAGLAIDSVYDFLYVTDRLNNRVVRLTLSTGEFMGAIGYLTSTTPTTNPIMFSGGKKCPTTNLVAVNAWCSGGNFGTGLPADVTTNIDGRFYLPMGIVADPNGFLYVSDSNSRIIKIR